MIDGPEDRAPLRVVHLDPHAIAEVEIRRLGRAMQDGLDGAYLGEARIADAAIGHRLARAAIGIAIRHRAGADDRRRLHRVPRGDGLR